MHNQRGLQAWESVGFAGPAEEKVPHAVVKRHRKVKHDQIWQSKSSGYPQRVDLACTNICSTFVKHTKWQAYKLRIASISESFINRTQPLHRPLITRYTFIVSMCTMIRKYLNLVCLHLHIDIHLYILTGLLRGRQRPPLIRTEGDMSSTFYAICNIKFTEPGGRGQLCKIRKMQRRSRRHINARLGIWNPFLNCSMEPGEMSSLWRFQH